MWTGLFVLFQTASPCPGLNNKSNQQVEVWKTSLHRLRRVYHDVSFMMRASDKSEVFLNRFMVQRGKQAHLFQRGLCGGCWRGASSSLEPQRLDTPCPAGPGTDEAHTPAPPSLQHKHTHTIYIQGRHYTQQELMTHQQLELMHGQTEFIKTLESFQVKDIRSRWSHALSQPLCRPGPSSTRKSVYKLWYHSPRFSMPVSELSPLQPETLDW